MAGDRVGTGVAEEATETEIGEETEVVLMAMGGSQQRRVFVTAEMAGVPEGTCLLCGEHDHKFTDPKCKYNGKKLMPSPCRKCLRGAHPTATCLA